MTQTADASPKTFDALPLSAEVRRAVDELGFVHPTPVQLEAYGPIVEGADCIVQARTGTGKTAAFGLPIVDKRVDASPGVQALVLAPTRELALQSAREIERLGRYRGIRTVAVYGGAAMERQVEELAQGAQIVSGTPGRVLDHLRRGTLDPSRLRVLVLDEADEMLSMGFARELHAILEQLPEERQTLFFSATIDDEVRRMSERHMRSPRMLSLSGDDVGAKTIAHFVYHVSGRDRVGDLRKILEIENPESAIVFCNTKAETERVAQALRSAGFDADWLNGDLPQSEREKVMAATREGKLRFLVATDVAARGIDISHLTHVINYELPEAAEQYVHRTGRTGRAGRTGTAISLVSPREIGTLYYIRLQYKIFPVEKSLPSAGEERTRLEADRIDFLAEATRGSAVGELDLAVARRLLSHVNAERIVAGLVAQFFGARQGDVDDQAAAARRARLAPAAAPMAPGGASADRTRGAGAEDGEGEGRRRPDDARGAAGGRAAERAEGEARGGRQERGGRAGRGARTDSVEPQERGNREDHDGARTRRESRPRDDAALAAASAHPQGTQIGVDAQAKANRTAPNARHEAASSDVRCPEEDGPPSGAGIPDGSDVERNDAEREGVGDRDEDTGMATLYLNVGRREGARPGEISRFLRETAGLEREQIGRIRIRDKHTFVGVPVERIDAVLDALTGRTFLDRPIVAERARANRAGA
jgi:ATP-dependent RNA helicase DeaD